MIFLIKPSFIYNKQRSVIRFFLCFLQAAKACKALGSAVLATVSDKTANNFIKGKLSGNSWIGATDQTKVNKPSQRTYSVDPR